MTPTQIQTAIDAMREVSDAYRLVLDTQGALMTVLRKETLRETTRPFLEALACSMTVLAARHELLAEALDNARGRS